MRIAELQKKNGEKSERIAEIKSLIAEILREESGDFDFIMRELMKKFREEEKDFDYDTLKKDALNVLDSLKGLKKDRGGKPKGCRVKVYSLG